MTAGAGYEPTPCRIASQAFTALRPEIARPLRHGGRSTALIDFVPSCQDTCTQFVNVLDPLHVDLLLHYRPHFVVDRIYIRALGGMKSGVSILAAQLSHEPYDVMSRYRILRGNVT